MRDAGRCGASPANTYQLTPFLFCFLKVSTISEPKKNYLRRYLSPVRIMEHSRFFCQLNFVVGIASAYIVKGRYLST